MWNDDTENTTCVLGEKAAGLRWIHEYQARRLRAWGTKLSIWSMMFNTASGVVSLSLAQMPSAQMYAMYICGVISIFATMTQVLRHYYSIDYETAMHVIMSKRCGALYRFIETQLSLSRNERKDAAQLRDWTTMEFEMIQQLSPTIDYGTVQAFKKKFPSVENLPDVVAKDFEIRIIQDQDPS